MSIEVGRNVRQNVFRDFLLKKLRLGKKYLEDKRFQKISFSSISRFDLKVFDTFLICI